MYPFTQHITPAAKNHMEAQLSFFNDMSKSMFRTVQQYSDLNIQLAQTMLEEGALTSQQVITAHRPTEAFSAVAQHAQPAAEKLRAYQQHISRIAADTHVDLAKVAEEHVAETSRTARELAYEVARVTSEETEKTMRAHQDTLRKFTDPFQHFSEGNAHQHQGRGNEMRGSQTLQSGQNGVESRDTHASMQGGTQHPQAGTMPQPGTQAGAAGKQPGGRKET